MLSRFLALASTLVISSAGPTHGQCPEILDTEVKDMQGHEIELCERYHGDVLLIVNTASKCGFTSQYQGLQELHERYAAQGLRVLAFPSNDFAHQEPGSDREIREFTQEEYGVEFPVFAKLHVRGKYRSPLYRKLSQAGFPGPKWNFQKYLISRQGKVVASFDPWISPASQKLTKAIERELSKPAPEAARKDKDKE